MGKTTINNNNNNNLNQWVSGFVDGEGCFCVSFSVKSSIKSKIEIRPSFSVSQKADKTNINFNLLSQLVQVFGCGYVRFSKFDRTYKYEIRNLKLIITNVIPFFNNYKLMTAKKNDFELFKKICFLINSSKHLSYDGLVEIINLAFLMNVSGKRKYSKEFLLKLLDKMKV